MDGINVTAVTDFNGSLVSWPKNSTSSYTALEAFAIGSVLFLVIVVTIVGNILVCIAVCLVRKLRRPCNYLLVSLAVSDLCVAILVMPLALLYLVLGKWPFGKFMCDLWVSFDVLSCTASILNLCMISVDRYYAITKPLEYGVKRTPRRMLVCVLLVWLGAACISLPPVLILGNEHSIVDGVPHCIVCQNSGYQIYATLGSFYIPLTVMITVYYKIFQAARKIVLEERRAQTHLENSHCYLEISVKNGVGPVESKIALTERNKHGHRASSSASTVTTYSGIGSSITRDCRCCSMVRRSLGEYQCPVLMVVPNSNGNNKKSVNASKKQETGGKKLRFQLAKERKASTTLGIIMSTFTVCWLPFFVLALVRPFLSDPSSIPSSLSSLFLWLGYANSLLNPVIYATLNRDFRRPFQQILYFKCGSLNHMMREEFYHSQYGDPEPQHSTHYCVIPGEPTFAPHYTSPSKQQLDETLAVSTDISQQTMASESFL
ncbi:5-hydroxytryptamine receptor 1-like [Daktulosphaira vitifoliae]|uniref:5-hydroxytryptamine receptor 1-like n=1 Tax=Daktulosphaira vitifoliae TaxID=58002 RepID=UPI0021AA0D49|nr:5-hydroxytryptamine receptor 1-like [Daktulosphaira vitifoliae]XP_050522287.1 5-hydroxytryptamine receptor 1-like [Daktulosphaira vitifoliae]XP_050522288.1 5-hydroxytryptamine receptor 1-like [Daktulosphaira vitifoliae]